MKQTSAFVLALLFASAEAVKLYKHHKAKADPLSPENMDPWVYKYTKENIDPYTQWHLEDNINQM